MTKKRRDDFTGTTRNDIAKGAGWLCSYPGCRAATVGATADGKGVIDIGTASHIAAAAPGGPRYDANMSEEVRRSAENGIWMCRDHGKAIDSDDAYFTVEILRQWKRDAETESWRRVLRHELLPAAPPSTDKNVLAFVRDAAQRDLGVFKNTAKWPKTSVALTLKVEGFKESATTNALARAVTTLDDLILVAPPGMGKTTTVFQVADGILSQNAGIPLVVPLSDWATDNVSILDSILKRPAFQNVSEAQLRSIASEPGVVLLLDGWNELDAAARDRARVQVESLKAQLPKLGLLISARQQKQGLDVPFAGKQVDLLPLDYDQQMEIANGLRGEAGVALVDQAWRTSGVRELVSIPLYLTALLSLPAGTPFPTTKEEVLRRFVDAHEADPRRRLALELNTKGFQLEFLDGLAVAATHAANTAITDANARTSISATADWLISAGQIVVKPEPNVVLDVLINSHVLMRAADAPGVSFQHQQFQEWYASHTVERHIVRDVGERSHREKLKAVIFNHPGWEESILFAIERMARGGSTERAACCEAILAAFEVDPLLSAEMISRATDEVWAEIAATIQDRVTNWHAAGKADRALRFMMNSGRSEFLEYVWPLITHANDQVSYRALRNCRLFHPSILGADAVERIKALPLRPRELLLQEIVSHSGMDGLELATMIAKDDPAPEVQASVADAMSFRHAGRHVVQVLKDASDATFDLLKLMELADEVGDEAVRQKVAAARVRAAQRGNSEMSKLRKILDSDGLDDRGEEVATIIGEMNIEKGRDAEAHLIHRVRQRYPDAVAEGLLRRVLSDRVLYYGVDDILAAAAIRRDDELLVELTLAGTSRNDFRSEAAASVLGSIAAGRIIDVLMELGSKLTDDNGDRDQSAIERYHLIKQRVAHIPGASLVAAIAARSTAASNSQMEQLAHLLHRRPETDSERARPFSSEDLISIRRLVLDWGARMLEAGDATRSQLLDVATLAQYAPDVSLLPLLKRLLDENIRRYRDYREKFKASGNRELLQELQRPMMGEYRSVIAAIKSPETAAMMREYLADTDFGEEAASVLVSHWISANEPPPDRQFFSGVDFKLVHEKRQARVAQVNATSDEAEAIFAVIERLLAHGASEEQRKLAASLGVLAVRLPHGQRDDIVKQLLAIIPRRARSTFLLNLILSGANVESAHVVQGVAETLEAAKKERWILTQSDSYELRQWLQLMPFTNRPSDLLQVWADIPDAVRIPGLLEQVIDGLTKSPSASTEEVFFKLAEQDPRFYGDHHWLTAARAFGTASAARRLIDLTANGTLKGKEFNNPLSSRELGALIATFPEIRQYVYGLLKSAPDFGPFLTLVHAVLDNPDAEGLLLLVDFETKHRRWLVGWSSIEKVVTEHVPDKNWSNAYNVVPIPATELRKSLLARVTDGSADDAAARCLITIDVFRDDYGLPSSEPRHPDLASGKSWPLMMADPNATAT